MRILKLYMKYIKSIIINPAALIIILGLSFIPSCYAWITLKANWNPYVDTGNIPIAVVNEDAGTIINNQIVNYGDKIIQALQNNTDMKWTFVGKKVANEGVKTGDYYSEIIIPQNFSEDLKTLSIGTPIKPTITYIVNEKSNAIATKISDLATDQLSDKIKQIFLKSINETLLNQANSLGNNLKQNAPMLIGLKNVISNTSQDISNIQNSIRNDNTNLLDLNNYLNNLKNNSNYIESGINSLKNITSSSESLLNSLKNNLNLTNTNINNNINELNSFSNKVNSLINDLKSTENKEDLLNLVQQIISINTTTQQILSNILNDLQNINTLYASPPLNNIITLINKNISAIAVENNNLNQLQTEINSGENYDNTLNSLQTESSNILNNIKDLTNKLTYNWITPIINNIDNELKVINDVTKNINSLIPQMNTLQTIGDSISLNIISKTEELNSKLNTFNNSLNKLKENTDKITTNNLNTLINLLEKNPNTFANYLSSPVTIKVEELYGMSIFGIGLAPFYTVLSIWVGALLCTSLLTTSDKNAENGTKKRLIQIHFAKMLLFLTINIVQTLIVTLGDVFLLGIHPANLFLLLFFALLTSITFTVIIFTLVSLTGNIGKATAIVIMVVQVAGSGAIYPIQVNPQIFQNLQFIWPFTYAMDGFRQSIGGPYFYNVKKDIIALLIFIIIFLFLFIGKIFFYKSSTTMEKLFKESGL